MIPPIILFLIILSILVFVHEVGHFFTAKRCGIKVEEFGLGLPPRAWGKKIGETIYSINWLPIGGFVKIKGEDFEDYNAKDKTNFINKKPWQKALVLVAGVLMNVILGVLIFYFILGINGWKSNTILLISDYQFKYGDVNVLPNVITFVESGSPAEEVGIQFADRITQLSYGQESITPESVKDVRSFLKDKPDVEINVVVQNINTKTEASYLLTPYYNEEIQQPALGVALNDSVEISYERFPLKLFAGILHSGNVLGYSFDALGTLVRNSIKSKDIAPVAQGVSGPVGIFGVVKAISDTAGDKFLLTILDLTAVLSLSLAIINLLPIPALDGGRLVFVIYEWISGRRPSPKLEAKAHQIGFAILIFLILLVTVKDIFQLI